MFQCQECRSLFERPAYGERHEFAQDACTWCGRPQAVLGEPDEEWCQHYACPRCGGAAFVALADDSWGSQP